MDIRELDEINPHLALAVSESAISDGERAWLRWVKEAEKLLGHSLDGNQHIEGYSLDYAHDAFRADLTPAQYAAEVKDAKVAAAVDQTAFTRSYKSPNGLYTVEICPNHSGLLFWRSKPLNGAAWSQWMPVAETSDYEKAARIVFARFSTTAKTW